MDKPHNTVGDINEFLYFLFFVPYNENKLRLFWIHLVSFFFLFNFNIWIECNNSLQLISLFYFQIYKFPILTFIPSLGLSSIYKLFKRTLFTFQFFFSLWYIEQDRTKIGRSKFNVPSCTWRHEKSELCRLAIWRFLSCSSMVLRLIKIRRNRLKNIFIIKVPVWANMLSNLSNLCSDRG